MLIRNAEIDFGERADIRVTDGIVTAVSAPQSADSAGLVIDANGAALLPSLQDHHFHLLAFAASLDSVSCGPPTVTTATALEAALLARQAARPGSWIRGIGYHSSVAGDIDRHWLDKILPTTAVRLQHRGGRLWILNSCALDLLAAGPTPPSLETIDGQPTGRLYDGDSWLRAQIGATLPPLRQASEFLLSRGVTALTDTTPSNGLSEWELLRKAQADGDLAQDILMMGGAALDHVKESAGLRVGARKFHLREAALPDLAETAAEIKAGHAAGRPAAFHCVTLTELLFALGALNDAGVLPGDRIEHAGVVPTEILPLIAAQQLTVVTQPTFIHERGDAYLEEVAAIDQPFLYRLRAFLESGIRLAGSTDAPFGDADPWTSMQAAVTRQTRGGAIIGGAESLTPEQALALFTSPLDDPGGPSRRIRAGTKADFCLIDRPWAEARRDLSRVKVVRTIKAGRVLWDSNIPSPLVGEGQGEGAPRPRR